MPSYMATRSGQILRQAAVPRRRRAGQGEAKISDVMPTHSIRRRPTFGLSVARVGPCNVVGGVVGVWVNGMGGGADPCVRLERRRT